MRVTHGPSRDEILTRHDPLGYPQRGKVEHEARTRAGLGYSAATSAS